MARELIDAVVGERAHGEVLSQQPWRLLAVGGCERALQLRGRISEGHLGRGMHKERCRC